MTDDSQMARPRDAMVTTVATADSVPALARRFDAGSRIDLSRFDDASTKRIQQIVAATPVLDGRTVNSFGLEPQSRANAFLDELLAGIRTYEVGDAGALVAELASGVKMLDIPGMKKEAEDAGGLLAAIPLIGKSLSNFTSAFARFRARQATILAHFEKIEQKGRREMADLSAMDSRLDRLVEQNLQSLRELGLYVAAGQMILDRESARFDAARAQALQASDAVALTQVRDQGEQINAFETRIMKLALAMQDALTSVPQTRLTQSAVRIEYANILDTLMFDIPRLKRAILRVAALKQISDASKANAARKALADQTAAAGAQLLNDAYIKAKESQGGALADVAAMGEIADTILGLIDKGAQIDARNRESRVEAMRRLESLKVRFVEGLARSAEAAVRSSAA